MPDTNGAFKGQGWSRAREDAYVRIFGDAAAPNPRPTSLTTAQVRAQYAAGPIPVRQAPDTRVSGGRPAWLRPVPAAPSPEVEDVR